MFWRRVFPASLPCPECQAPLRVVQVIPRDKDGNITAIAPVSDYYCPQHSPTMYFVKKSPFKSEGEYLKSLEV
jgi:hypothetical protein